MKKITVRLKKEPEEPEKQQIHIMVPRNATTSPKFIVNVVY